MTRRGEAWHKPKEWKAFRPPEDDMWQCRNCFAEFPSVVEAWIHMLEEKRLDDMGLREGLPAARVRKIA